MPAMRLDEFPVAIHLFDVAGQDSDDESQFIRHIALSAESRHDVTVETPISAIHMGPPLARVAGGVSVQAVGSALLTADEVEQVRVYVDELFMEMESQRVRRTHQYVIHPHFCERDEDVSYRRYSCAGFVIEAYRSSGIDIVDTDARRLPKIDLRILKQAYADQRDRLEDAEVRERFGLSGDGPWPIVLAGYVLNSLSRSPAAIRDSSYQPLVQDAHYPPTGKAGS